VASSQAALHRVAAVETTRTGFASFADTVSTWRAPVASAFNGRGPWWNAGASHMHAAVPTVVFRQLGLLSLLEEHRRLTCAREPAGCRTARPGGVGGEGW